MGQGIGRVLMKEHTWQEAIQLVLREAGGPLHYVRISEQIIAQGLKTRVGANPAGSVAAVLSQALSDENSLFQRVGSGEYALKETLRQAPAQVTTASVQDETEIETGALRAFGMYWQRDLVVWSGKPRLFGRQGPGASEVNFCDQVGVYLLHDRDRVIYVGRATDTMFARLKAHTIDRLGGRWDRFSWFGLRSVREDGSLSEPSSAWTHTVVIETLEALLIESLEPPLNRRRGDNLSAAEYLQTPDPEIDKMRKSQVITDMLKAAGITQ